MQTILVIEDHQLLREGMISLLEFQGYRILEAIDGKSGIQSAIAASPDLIICDVDLPHASGFDVLTTLRNASIQIPMIMLTGFAYEDARLEALKLGASAYLFKPCPFAKLLAETKRCLGNLEAPYSLSAANL